MWLTSQKIHPSGSKPQRHQPFNQDLEGAILGFHSFFTSTAFARSAPSLQVTASEDKGMRTSVDGYSTFRIQRSRPTMQDLNAKLIKVVNSCIFMVDAFSKGKEKLVSNTNIQTRCTSTPLTRTQSLA